MTFKPIHLLFSAFLHCAIKGCDKTKSPLSRSHAEHPDQTVPSAPIHIPLSKKIFDAISVKTPKLVEVYRLLKEGKIQLAAGHQEDLHLVYGKRQRTPLLEAIAQSHESVAVELIALDTFGLSLTQADAHQTSPLHLAIEKKQFRVIDVLLEWMKLQ